MNMSRDTMILQGRHHFARSVSFGDVKGTTLPDIGLLDDYDIPHVPEAHICTSWALFKLGTNPHVLLT